MNDLFQFNSRDVLDVLTIQIEISPNKAHFKSSDVTTRQTSLTTVLNTIDSLRAISVCVQSQLSLSWITVANLSVVSGSLE